MNRSEEMRELSYSRAVIMARLGGTLAALELGFVGAATIAGYPMAALVLGVLMAVVAAAGLLLAWMVTGRPRPALTARGIAVKVALLDRQLLLVPWSDIAYLRIARSGLYRYLYIWPRDPGRYTAGGSEARWLAIRAVSLSHSGAPPLQVYLPGKAITKDQVRHWVWGHSGGTVQVH